MLRRRMPADRRVVRVSPAFFDHLDEQLGSTRGKAGKPSATDFLVLDLPAIVERFATDFEGLPEFVEGFGTARVLVATSQLARAVAVYGVLDADGTIELIGVEIDTSE